MPSLNPLLASSNNRASSSPRKKKNLISAIALALVVFASFVFAATRVHHSIAAKSHVFPILPAMAIACLALILPLALFVGCIDEFSDNVNPLSPKGYYLIAQRTYKAFGSSSSGKVSGKDL